MNKNKLRTSLVRNETATPTRQLEKLTANLSTNLVRNDTLEGRPYIVVPMVMMLEGVHQGSGGPLYYPAEELSNIPAVWNAKPVVVYHPEINGQGVSACSPDVFNTQKVGIIMNAGVSKTKQNGKELTRLTAEAWLEPDRIDAVDSRIGEAISNNQIMELSTGLFVDAEPEEGDWNGEHYTAIARNYRPDHLALLPDKVGACSVADGAGFMRNQLVSNDLKVDLNVEKDIQKAVQTRANDYAARLLAPYVTANEMSHDDIRSQLRGLLKEKHKEQADPDGWIDLWIEDVYESFLVYEFQGKLWMLSYTKSSNQVQLGSEEPQEVYRYTEYRKVSDDSPIGNETTNQKQTKVMNKEQIINGLIENEKTPWSEDHREFLMGLEEDKLKEFETHATATTNDKGAGDGDDSTSSDDQSGIQTHQASSVDEYIDQAPPEYQEVLRNGLNSLKAEKAEYIKTITSNKHCVFTKNQLESKDVEELKALATLAQGSTLRKGTPNFAGQGTPASEVQNTEVEPLVAPTGNAWYDDEGDNK